MLRKKICCFFFRPSLLRWSVKNSQSIPKKKNYCIEVYSFFRRIERKYVQVHPAIDVQYGICLATKIDTKCLVECIGYGCCCVRIDHCSNLHVNADQQIAFTFRLATLSSISARRYGQYILMWNYYHSYSFSSFRTKFHCVCMWTMRNFYSFASRETYILLISVRPMFHRNAIATTTPTKKKTETPTKNKRVLCVHSALTISH